MNTFRVIIFLTGILGGGSFNQTLKSHWLNPINSDYLSAQNVAIPLTTRA